MDNGFKIKKQKDIPVKLEGTLDSLHEKIVGTVEDKVDYFVKNADILVKYYERGSNKKGLYHDFLKRQNLESSYFEEDNAQILCENCSVLKKEIKEDSIFVCLNCGSESSNILISDNPGFKDPPKECIKYSYKTSNHFNEILNQFEGKTYISIPDEVLNEIIFELKKQRLHNKLEDVTENIIEEILKKNKRNKYYDQSIYILFLLNGKTPPIILPEIREKIQLMFQEIQTPFFLYGTQVSDRKNLISYPYIFFKFFELLELDDYKSWFTLLKSRDRLIQHDEIWKKICNYLSWEFIPSI